MILRPRQKVFVDRCVTALREHKRTLGVAPTGAGKTVMLSAIARELGGRTLVLQHRDELTRQNMATFQRVAPGWSVSAWDASAKSWCDGATFAMVQTLSREQSLARMPAFDLLIVDEAHHARAVTYRRIIEQARERNPDLMVCGVTATPNRGDKHGLGPVFGNCADQINLGELIQAGHLVRPVAYVLDVGAAEQLAHVRKVGGEYVMGEASAALRPHTDAVIDRWLEHAGKRSTVFFCADIQHAEDVHHAMMGRGIASGIVTSRNTKEERRYVFEAFDAGALRCLVNVAVATEGWDCARCSCVALLRPSSYQSTMIQMIGRGLRIADPERYPDLSKTDCVVLDFGMSLQNHGGIEQVLQLFREPGAGDAPIKDCPECGATIPAGCITCPMCGGAATASAGGGGGIESTDDIELTLFEIFKASPFRWIDVDGAQVCTAFTAMAIAFEWRGAWHSAGVVKEGKQASYLCRGTKEQAIAKAADFMRLHGDSDAASKQKRWLDRACTAKQVKLLQLSPLAVMSRYEASCRLDLKFNRARLLRVTGIATIH